MDKVQLVLDNLIVGYNQKQVLPPLTFALYEGDFLLIVGANGTGKSTLCKTLLNLQSALSGKIILNNGVKSQDIGYLPQTTEIQKDFPATCFEVVLSGTVNMNKFFGFITKKQKDVANEKMKMLDISHLKNTSFKNLSGGQKQKVLLARALCSAKKILLLDEPTSSLDVDATNEIYTILKKLNEEEKITIIMISHDINSLNYVNKVLRTGEDVYILDAKEYKRRLDNGTI